ncbi:MAG TPA: aminotransferase class I/II-fold pyridoxal phosphate-dependent enzyme [Cyclobacteriaceae bacterium]|nr:aminotransferase class I/II-fold pyridoxal phosphate-dependent enzyme [Cyclobacteriaceae bacterium]
MIKTAQRIAEVEEYYFSKKLQEVRSLDTSDFPVINLGIGSPDLMPDEKTIAALSKTALQPTSHGYQNYKGVPSLRQAIADFSKRIYGIELNPNDEILPLMGSKEGIMHISMAFVDEGDTVLIPDPGYPTYASVSKLVGANVETYKLSAARGWQVDINDLESRDLSGVKIMWLNSPHMPTGSVMDKTIMERIISLAQKNNFLVVNDNPYSLILNNSPESLLSIDGANEVALELNSLSKSHNMAGWRVGWVAGKKELIDAVLKVKSNMDSGMFLGIQNAAVEALNQPRQWFVDLNDTYKKRRKVAFEILDELECAYDEAQVGLFVWAKAPEHVKSVEKWIDEILYGSKVFITPGFIFGNAGKEFIRISLCANEDNLRTAKERIGKLKIEGKSKQRMEATS